MKQSNVQKIVSELDISRSYLYKIVNEKNIQVVRNKAGRFIWDKNAMYQLQLAFSLDNSIENTSPWEVEVNKRGLKLAAINNRRYLGNKYKLSDFIRGIVDEYCSGVNIIMDIFSGTGAVANIFTDKMIMTNDLLYFNYLIHYAWFYQDDYSENKIIDLIENYNQVQTIENNYMRCNFSDTFFSADNCSKIGFIREDIERKYRNNQLNFKEYSILITSLIYAMDKIANTVGHYDAYRKNIVNTLPIELSVILPSKNLNKNNQCFNANANQIIDNIQCDLLYLDPPYNSRQYCDAYHVLENVARWEKPEVSGIARKMDRSNLKSEYCTKSAVSAFEDLIKKAKCKYILLSYNNMSDKGNDRSNAKISDNDIFRILGSKGKVRVFENSHKAFSTGKSDVSDNIERLFLCEVFKEDDKIPLISSPLNYTGGKHKLLNQIIPLLPPSECFLDLFCGGGNVGINAKSSKVIFNDNNIELIRLFNYLHNNSTQDILDYTNDIIQRFELSDSNKNSYIYYDCDSSKGLAKYNKSGFLKLRESYNKSRDIALLYVLIIFSFNNQIRFNKKGDFNLPVGKRDFNLKMQNKLKLFTEKLRKIDVSFQSLDFRMVDLGILPKNTLIYCDPPYLITLAGYNENNRWTLQDEQDLLDFLNECNQKGFKFALSNVLQAKNKENTLLINWLNNNGYHCAYLNKGYGNSNYQRKDKNSISTEVLITNY